MVCHERKPYHTSLCAGNYACDFPARRVTESSIFSRKYCQKIVCANKVNLTWNVRFHTILSEGFEKLVGQKREVARGGNEKMREPESRLRTEDEGRGEDRGKYVMSVAVGMTGVEAYRIRRYEEAGLLRPARSSGGRRLLSDEDICLVRDAAKLESEGVNLTGIKVILRMRRVDGVVPDEPRENGGG